MGDVRRAWTAYAVSQAGSGIGTGALPLVAILVLGVSDWQVSVLAAVAGIARAAVVVPLGPWVEFHRKRLAMIAADVLRCATLASVPVGALTAIVVDAVSFLLSAVALGRTRRREPVPAIPASRWRWLAEMTAGWRHIVAHPVLRVLFVHALLFGGCLVASTPLIAILMLKCPAAGA